MFFMMILAHHEADGIGFVHAHDGAVKLHAWEALVAVSPSAAC
jgi:hypothetical protein